MFKFLQRYNLGSWEIPLLILLYPINWLLWTFEGDPLLITVKLIFLFLPIILLIGVFWCTILSLVTVFFRPNRVAFIATILISWWDSGKAIFLFWGGLFRFTFLSIGWLWGTLRIFILGLYYTLREILFLPFTFIHRSAKSYFKPGIPWVAVLMSLAWIILEALIFTAVLEPMASEVISSLTESPTNPVLLQIFLFFFLFVVIGGSFACMHGLVEAIKTKNTSNIIKMLMIEAFIMGVEVMFLYREFINALAPTFYQLANVKMGEAAYILLGAFSWLGIRSGTWFFFGKYGTPTLLSIISREGITDHRETASKPTMIGAPLEWIKHIVSNLQREINWFSQKGNEMLDAFVLPAVQILAVITNFFMILLTSHTLFNLPLRSLKEVKNTKELISEISRKG